MTRTALIQRRNDDLGKGRHYKMCEDLCLFGDGIISVEIRKAKGYRLTLKEIVNQQGKFLTATLSTPLSYNLRNFVLLKRLYNYFDEDISFKDFHEGIESGLEHDLKGTSGLDSKINISPEYFRNFLDVDVVGNLDVDVIGFFFPHKRISELSQEIIQLYKEKERTSKTMKKTNQYIHGVGKKLDSRSDFEGQLKDFRVGLRDTRALSKISKLNQEITQLYNKKEEIIQPIDKINQTVEERLGSGNDFDKQLEDFKVGLRNTSALSKLSNRRDSLTKKIKQTKEKLSDRQCLRYDSLEKKIKQTENKLNKYFNFINYKRGINITVKSGMRNAYEIITDFYRQLLSPKREEEDFDVVKARKEIETGWSETKRLAGERLK